MKSESEVAQSCPTLCDPMDCSLPGSSVHGIFQVWILEWGLPLPSPGVGVAIAFSRGSCRPRDRTWVSRIVGRRFTVWATRDDLPSWPIFKCMCVCVCTHMCKLSPVWLFVTPWTVAHQVPLPMEFPRQEYWSGLPYPSPGGLPNPGIKPMSPLSPELLADSLLAEPLGKPRLHLQNIYWL